VDARNRYHTPMTYKLVRAEQIALMLGCVVLAALEAPQINWLRGAVAFWIIDILGYLPGAIAYRRSGGRPLPRFYHALYNVTHTWFFSATLAAIWAALGGGLEWAMLAFPFHLAIDRGVFGNVFKPPELAFEAVAPTEQQLREILLDPAPQARAAPENVAREVIEHPSGYLALSKKNLCFSLPDRVGFVAYRPQGRHWVMFGGVHAEAEHREALLEAFLREARDRRRGIIAVQVREPQRELFARHGFTVNQFGTSYGLSLKGYSFGGTQKMKLRNKIKRAQKSGLRVVELGVEVPRTAEWFSKLQQISDAWLVDKGKPELEFMIGELGALEDLERRVFMALDQDDRAVAFITYVPAYGKEAPGFLHDLTRRVPDAPPGAMELCNSFAIERFMKEGRSYLHFGFTPFIVDDQPGQAANGLLHRVVRFLRAHGEKLYPAQTQVAYKLKWGTDLVEREYIAVDAISMRAIWDLMRLTRSV